MSASTLLSGRSRMTLFFLLRPLTLFQGDDMDADAQGQDDDGDSDDGAHM